MYGWIGPNYMMICKTKYYRRFNTLLQLPFNYVAQGREIHHKQCKALFVL